MPSSQLRIVEQQYTNHRQSRDLANHGAEKRRESKRSISDCSSESLASVLRSCEASASPQVADGQNSHFCGTGCKALVDNYAAKCSGNNRFSVMVSGACKLAGANLTLECVYAVVIVDDGLTVCERMVQDVDYNHEEVQYLFNRSKEYVEEPCCSLNSTYSDDPVHRVTIDHRGITITPALVAPWQNSDTTDYSAIVEVTRSDLCLKPPTTAATTDLMPTTSASEKVINKVESSSMISGAHRTSWLSIFVRVICLLALSLSIVAH